MNATSAGVDGTTGPAEHFETIVVGGGQAGLSVGYHLARRGRPFVILDAGRRVGDSWRSRWDSLRLFSPARFSGLDGMPFPGDPHSFPTKDEMGDYLEAYARRFDLPVRNGVRVERLSRDGDGFVLRAGERTYRADSVVVAMASYQRPHVPAFAAELDPAIVQLHSGEYRNPSQLREGPVLLVGAGNSGSEIAMELAAWHQIWMAGRNVGQLPFRIDGFAGLHALDRLVLRGLFHRVLTVRTPVGRKARPTILIKGGPLIRVRGKALSAAGVERVPRVSAVRDGLPVLDDGRVLEPSNVVWCTGFHAGLDWIDLPVHGDHEPQHTSGVVATQPGLYFVGLHFLHALSSSMIHGVGRDAERIAAHIVGASTVAGRGAGAASSAQLAAAG